ncbi:MAG: sigma-70 family RNA polymerase sigma factor [Verrucomicrobia bacterium]|nr:sigma-70 family RNA polymerase sigma factor [Verrucomicrobiota bacterium]
MNARLTVQNPKADVQNATASKPGTKDADAASKASEDAPVQEWVARAQQGDDAAFEALVHHFEKRVFGIAFRMLNRYEDAADVSQEVFVKLYKSIGQFEGRSKFSTWLFMMSVNMCRNRRRTLTRLSVEKQILDIPQYEETGSAPRDIEDPAPGPREIAAHHDIRALVNDSLAHLPEEYREAVVLRDIQFLTYEDIADTLDVSLGTVKSRIARGRAMLKVKLQRFL